MLKLARSVPVDGGIEVNKINVNKMLSLVLSVALVLTLSPAFVLVPADQACAAEATGGEVSVALTSSSEPAGSGEFANSSESALANATKTVSSAAEFLAALSAAQDGDVIDLGGSSIQINAQTEGDDPIVNKANITIQNGELSLRPAGIVQGADLTLKNLTLTFQNAVRNGIFANGFNTTLENVKKSSSATYSIHVVMGPILNAQSTYIPAKSTQSAPTLSISGENTLGQIFMGAFDDIADNSSGTGFYNTFSPKVTIDPECKSVFADGKTGAIYACGVSECATQDLFDNDKLGDIMLPNPTYLRVNSMTAAINLGGAQVKNVYGDTGTGKKVAVNYYGGENLTENVVLNSVGELNVKTGAFKISSTSTFAGSSQALGVSAGATLIAGALGDASFYNFNGGGTLALGTTSNLAQTLTFTGAVSGTTDIVFGDANGFWKTAVADSTYIKAAASKSDSFTVSNASCVPAGKVWNRNEDGEWSFVSNGTTHEHTFGYVAIDDNDHSYECTDPKCPDADKGQLAIEEHYDDNEDGVCDACGYEKTEIHDIFVAADSSKLEQLKARVFNALLKKETSIDVSDIGISPDEVTYAAATGTVSGTTALAGIVREHPLFSTLAVSWSGFSFDTSGSGSGGSGSTSGNISTVNVTYLDYTWKIEDLRKFIKAYDECMSRIPAKATEFQKAAIIHDWVCEHTTYSLGADKADFALGAIYNGAAVCAGYAQAYQFLCQQAGLKCNYVSGTTTKEAHAWNKVCVSGQWFLVDTTWDRGLATSTTFSHAYFMCNDAEFKEAADGGHAGDTNVSGAEPANTEWYFANKYWEGKTGALSADLLAQDPKLTKVVNFEVNRIAGSDAIATNYETVKADIKANGAPEGLIVCTNGHYIDSLSAAALSGLLNYPIVIVNGADDSLNSSAKNAVDYAADAARAAGKEKLDIVIMGGNAAVSDGIEKQLAEYDLDKKCDRVAGSDGYKTNIAAYDYGAKRGTWNEQEVLVATGNSYYDALGAGSYAAAKQAFILLANQYSEETNAAVYERAANSECATICGGTAAVTKATEEALEKTSKCTINRQWGDNAYQTNIKFAKYATTQGLTYEGAGISTGTGYWDALGSSHILGASKSVMFLVSPDEKNNQDVYTQLSGAADTITNVSIFGGTAAVTNATARNIETAIAG